MTVQFKAKIVKDEKMDVFYIPLELDVEKTFGKKRFKAKIWYNDVLYRGLIAKYDGGYFLMINKAIRAQLNKKAGDIVNVKIEQDLEERIVELPTVLVDFFNRENLLKSVFDKLSYTHQKEYVQWITSAKREETLQNRMIKLKEMLEEKLKK
ncbi:MAG TPA: YdeI/OmpD-associated family protein [Chitinophagales bacterium]|nr:YdeI/OmpD-associated family protein [Chitinophagales bacterium]HNL84196.1 YdeI/OmpD-associated family protein [Chitinophagales bacterium]